MKFGVYAVRDLKVGFQSVTIQPNDAVAVRGFESTVINSDSVLFTHAEDFSLFKLGEFDQDSGRLIPLELPVQLIEASACLRHVDG
nr:MAG TPA: DNA binding protein [Microviridae sp.]